MRRDKGASRAAPLMSCIPDNEEEEKDQEEEMRDLD